MDGIDKYMIPLDSIRSIHAYDLMALASVVLLLCVLATGIVLIVIPGGLKQDAAIGVFCIIMAIITMSIACGWVVQSGCPKSIDTSKINDEYGITVTSMYDDVDKQGGIESHRLSYLHDGALVDGTLIVEDNKAGLFAGTGDKLTPVKPAAAHSATLVNHQR